MGLRDIIHKELRWSRHRLVALVFVFVLLPGAFAASSVFFQHVLPKDAPVAVVGGENSTADDRELVTNTVDLASKPIAYESRSAAIEDLEREMVYAVVEVPPGIADRNVSRVNMTITIDGTMVPYHQPSGALAAVVSRTLNRNLDKRVSVDRVVRGEELKLSVYLLPTFLMIVVATFSFAYLPYNLASEEQVLDRLRVETSLDVVVAGKMLFFGTLLLVPVGVFTGAARYLGYGVRVVAPGALASYFLTFLALGAVATAVTFLSRFSTAGRLLNVLVLFFVLGFSGLVYPAGFFSPVRREIIRRMPTHYAIIAVRSSTLQSASVVEVATWLAGMAGFAVACLVGLKLAIVAYERGS